MVSLKHHFTKLRKVRVLDESFPIYLDATSEDKYRLAAGDLETNDEGLIQNSNVPVRYRQELVQVKTETLIILLSHRFKLFL